MLTVNKKEIKRKKLKNSQHIQSIRQLQAFKIQRNLSTRVHKKIGRRISKWNRESLNTGKWKIGRNIRNIKKEIIDLLENDPDALERAYVSIHFDCKERGGNVGIILNGNATVRITTKMLAFREIATSRFCSFR